MVFILFRMFSKNLTKRRAENQKFIGWIWKAEQRRRGQARRADKDHKYFTCRCGAICRVPVGREDRHHLSQMRSEDRSEKLIQ